MSVPLKIKKLDEIFSKVVRLSYADKNGYVKCFTCSRIMYWKEIQNGHFIPRKCMALRFDTKNSFPQCPFCNCGKSGNLKVYEANIIKRFGYEHLEYLERKQRELKQYKECDLNDEIKQYKKLLSEFEII